MNNHKSRILATIVVALCATAAQATERFVSKGNAGAAAPYDTIATAAKEIQAAVDASVYGDIVTVLPSASTYTAFTVTNGITVRGQSGDWKNVVVDGNQQWVAVKITHPDAVVASITARRGHTRCFENSGGGTITNCHATLGNPKSSQDGSGHGVYNNNGKIFDTVIDNCKSSDHFSGLGLYQTGADAIADRLVITNNYSSNRTYGNWDRQCSAVSIRGGILRNSIIASNDFKTVSFNNYPQATGVNVNGGRVINCTIYGNTCSSTYANVGYGAYAAANGFFENCIIAGNLKSGSAADWGGTAANFINCATTATNGLPAGTVDVADTDWTFSFQPLPFPVKKLRDAGAVANAAADLGETDLFGNPRVMGDAPGIGPQEFEAGNANLLLVLDASAGEGFIPFSGSLASQVGGDTEGVTYYWDIDGDGATDISGPGIDSVPFSFAAPGIHDATLCVTNGAGDAATASVRLTAKARPRHYVGQDAANPVSPYLTPETAADDLQTCLDAVPDGAEIVILSGSRLTTSASIVVGKPAIIRGETGDFHDVVVAASGTHRMFEIANPEVTLSSLTISGGNYNNGGAGVMISNGGVVTNCRVTACTGYGTGVGIYNSGGILADCVIDGISMINSSDGNTSNRDYKGLGLYQEGAGAIADRCVITNCYSPVIFPKANSKLGAAACIAGGSLRNSLVAWNDAGKAVDPSTTSLAASGVLATDSAKVDNCTILGNVTQGSGRGVVPGLRLTDGAVARNCIALGNGDGFAETNNWAGAAASFTAFLSSDVTGVAGGVPASGEVLAIDPRGGMPALPANSPAIDAGVSLDWTSAGATDIGHSARTAGPRPDIGCTEAATGSIVCSFTASTTKGTDSFAATFTPSVSGTASSGALEYVWDFGDGSATVTAQSAAPVSHTFAYPATAYGIKTVTLAVGPAGGAPAASFARTVTLAPTRVYAANGNASAAYPYATPETAAPNIQTAIDAAFDGSEVIVLPSANNYILSSTLVIDKDITLTGATGDFHDVVINGNSGNTSRRTMLVKARNALIQNVTIRRGRGSNNTHSSRGASVLMTGSELRNCRVTEANVSDGVIAHGVFCVNGKVTDCLFDHNWNNGGHTVGGGVLALGSSSLIDRCVFTNNNSKGFYYWQQYKIAVVAVYDGTVRNCLVAHNSYGAASAVGSGFGAIGLYAEAATVENCTVVSNRYASKTGDFPGITPGIYAAVGSTVVNCLVDANFEPTSSGDTTPIQDNWCLAGASTFSHCATSPLEGLGGGGNFEPSRSDWESVPGERFAMPLGSRLIGKGENLPWMASARDLYGGARLVGRSADVGCVENQSRPATMFIVQ